MEYQNYHLIRLELFEKGQDKSKQELNNNRKLVSDTNTAGPERIAEKITAFECILNPGERNLEWQKVLLHWIEQQ